MFKKALALVCVVCVLLSFAGCSFLQNIKNPKDNNPTDSANQTTAYVYEPETKFTVPDLVPDLIEHETTTRETTTEEPTTEPTTETPATEEPTSKEPTTTKPDEETSIVPEFWGEKSVDEIVREVIIGKWGNGRERKNRLNEAGYDYRVVQAEVNRVLGYEEQPID